ncbi:MAG: type II secretion system protein [Alcanivoracaceae bacterium]|nr:type II secretion system protein [Alcanivoracaceae bacterium]
MTRRHSRGFTLVEILVSLVILAGVAIVLADTIGAGAVAHTRLDDTTRAWRVASDKLVELQVYQRWPGIGVQDETIERNDERWMVRTKISSGPYADTRRVDIEVGPEPEPGKERLVTWSVFSLLGKPYTAATAGGAGGNPGAPAAGFGSGSAGTAGEQP